MAEGVNPQIVRVGGEILNQPRYTFRLDAGYTHRITNDLIFYSNASASFSDSRIGDQYGDRTAKTTIVDANLGVRRGPAEFEFFAQNLTDERGPWFIRQQGFVGGPIPRTLGLRVRYHYQ